MNKEELNNVIKDVKKDLALSRTDLNIQMIRQGELYAYYARILSRALMDEKKAKLKMEMLESKIYRELNQHHNRVTERMVAVECHINKTWLKARQLVDETGYTVDVLKGITVALTHKKDMLVNLGATVRTEMERLNISMKGKNYGS